MQTKPILSLDDLKKIAAAAVRAPATRRAAGVSAAENTIAVPRARSTE